MEVKLRQVSEYLYHVEAYSKKWGWIDLTDRGHPVPLVDARRIQREAQAIPAPWLSGAPGAAAAQSVLALVINGEAETKQ